MKWSRLKHRNNRFLIAFFAALLLAMPARAQLAFESGEAPPTLRDLQEAGKPVTGDRAAKKPNPKDKLEDIVAEEKDLALKIRTDSMRDAARSYGARGGLSWRTKNIMDELKKSNYAMDKAFNFRRLLIKAPSNLFIEPPIVSEALNNFLVTPNGIEAAVADAIAPIAAAGLAAWVFSADPTAA